MTKDESLSIFSPERASLKVTFLIFSGSSIMCVASAVDPLRAAADTVSSQIDAAMKHAGLMN
jgi:transcriptional regulator GlxA family with amidase domain